MTAAAFATACGGSTDGDGSPNGGAGGTGQGGTAGTSGSGTGGTGGGTGGSGTGGTAGVGGGGTGGTSGSAGAAGAGGGYTCPTDLPGTWDSCELPLGAVCKWDVPCQSGVVSLEMECDPAGFAGWKLLPQACTKPYDSCPNTDLYCNDTWTKPMGTNPPSPCPAELPKAGASCFSGAFGGVWPNCGYPCGPGSSTWTIATCDPNYDGGASVWQLDGACDP